MYYELIDNLDLEFDARKSRKIELVYYTFCDSHF